MCTSTCAAQSSRGPPEPPSSCPGCCAAARCLTWEFQAKTIEELPRQVAGMSAALHFVAFNMPGSARVLCGAWNHFPSRCLPLAPAASLLFFPPGGRECRSGLGRSSVGMSAPVSAAVHAWALFMCPASQTGQSSPAPSPNDACLGEVII